MSTRFQTASVANGQETCLLRRFLQSKGRLKKFQTAFNPSING
ncbi:MULTISPECIES: hypothetical protein [unclassified Neisseria]|nr:MULTISPECIES: hypothetical protein [unclassified Neisseria]